ncbi:MAG: guanylate kinase [Oscillospiraceae bacterium]|nr:guanylate kinase [Oscillospiraceae bacterium]
MKRGRLLVISGPSGVGKTTAVTGVRNANPEMYFSVSATTRAMRPTDEEGVTYRFKTREEFLKLVDEGYFYEHAEYSGNLYGTPKTPVEEHLAAGEDVILDIEVQGGLQVKAQTPEAILIFLVAPSWEELERRLRSRGDTSEEDIQKRLKQARWEYTQAEQYDYIVVSEAPPECVVERINTILSAEGYRTRRNMNLLNLEESL